MSNLSPSNPIQPLSVGNVVSAGIRIFRSNLKRFLILSLIASLWFLLPVVLFIAPTLPLIVLRPTSQSFAALAILLFIVAFILAIVGFVYAYAKYAEISGRISRLTFQDLINQPETTIQARQVTQPRLWSFFAARLLVGLIFLAVNIGIFIVFAFASVISRLLLDSSSVFWVLISLLAAVSFCTVVFLYIRLFSRLFIVEVTLAIEEGIDATTAIGRSWNLTKGAVGRIQLIVFVTFLIGLLVNVPTQVVLSLLSTEAPANPAIIIISLLVLIIVSILSNALIMPFWQAIKAVIYYDLRSRKEGLGLELRDRG